VEYLKENQFIHVINNDTAEVKTVIGPQRVLLAGNERTLGKKIKNATIIPENYYATIHNPYDVKEKTYAMGQIKIVEGPCVYFPRYKEEVGHSNSAYILGKNEALKLMATKETKDHPAGDIWCIRGPCRYVPDENTQVMEEMKTVLVNANEGIYVQNTQTSEKKLVKGPCAYMYGPREVPFEKEYTKLEQVALGLTAPRSAKAAVVRLDQGHVLCVLAKDGSQSIINGPRVYMLEPDEKVKVLELSAGKPKKMRQIFACNININPDFMSDRFTVRTLDNAAMDMLITYKREYYGGKSNAHRIFSLPDFIGYTCTTLCSRIREEAAKFTFESLHKGTVGLLRKALFTKHQIDVDGNLMEKEGYYFPEIRLMITEIDVKQITPVNREINDLLNQSIKSNMIIFGRKMEQEANLQAEKAKIKAEEEVSKLKQSLIEIKNANIQKESMNEASLQSSINELRAASTIAIDKLRKEGHSQLESDRIKQIGELMATPAGQNYLKLMEINNMAEIKQNWILKTNSTKSISS